MDFRMYCPECQRYCTHADGCPHALEVKPLHQCSVCGEGIYEGDKYKDFGDCPYCYTCLLNLSPEELLDLVGDKITIAKKSEMFGWVQDALDALKVLHNG